MIRLIFILLLIAPSSLYALDYKDVMNAVGRIQVTRGNTSEVGTGTIFETDDKYVYMITAGHVVENHKGATNTVAFNNEGEFTNSYPFEVVDFMHPKSGKYAGSHNDLGILRIKREDFRHPIPTPIPLASANYLDPIRLEGESLFTMGCPNGGWMTGLIVRVHKQTNYVLYTKPLAKTGRSGSALVKDFKIVGIISGNVDEDSNGTSDYCTSPNFHRIHRWLETKKLEERKE
jgi:hypothetical protein